MAANAVIDWGVIECNSDAIISKLCVGIALAPAAGVHGRMTSNPFKDGQQNAGTLRTRTVCRLNPTLSRNARISSGMRGTGVK